MLNNIISGMLAKSFVALINFAILLVSSRYLGAASRGEISLYLLTIALVQLVNEIYTGYGLIHFIPRFDFRKTITAGLLFTIVVCPAVYALLTGFGKYVEGFVWAGLITALFVILNTFNCVLLLGRERVRSYHVLSLLQPALLLTGLCVAIFVFDDFTFTAFCWPLLFSFVFAATISSVMILLLPRSNGKGFSFSPVILNGLVYQGAMIMFILANRFSYYLLENKQHLGVYAAAASIMDASLVLGTSIGPVLISRVANRGDNADSAALSLSLGKLSFTLTVLCIGLLALLPDSFFIFLLGSDFAGLKKVMLAYAPGALVLSLFTAFSAFFTAAGRQKIVLWSYGAGLLTTLALAPFLVTRYNVFGAALSADISYLVMGVVLTFFFMRLNKFRLTSFGGFRYDLHVLRKAFTGDPR